MIDPPFGVLHVDNHLLVVDKPAGMLSQGDATGDADLVADIVSAGLGYLPAVTVVVSLAAALIGWAPRALGLVWLLVIWGVVVFYVADLLDWPQWAANVSPFDHVAPRPAQHGDTPELLWLSTITLTLLFAGATGYRRRPVG